MHVHTDVWVQMLLPNEVRWIGVAGYLQRNSSMSVKSFLPRRPVLSPFSTATENGRLARTLAWQLDGPGRESERWPGSLLWPPLTPAQPVSRPPPSPPQPWSATSLPSPGACSSDVPRRSTGPALAQLPTMLKGQGPPATQSICQAADQSLGSEKREIQTPDTLALSSPLKAQQRNAR